MNNQILSKQSKKCPRMKWLSAIDVHLGESFITSETGSRALESRMDSYILISRSPKVMRENCQCQYAKSSSPYAMLTIEKVTRAQYSSTLNAQVADLLCYASAMLDPLAAGVILEPRPSRCDVIISSSR